MLTVGGTTATAWHSANDGSGSGLDADTVDGIEASSFLRSDTDDNAAGFGGRSNVNSSGDPGLLITNGSRLGFDQSGTRSWTVKASGGNLNVASGDGSGTLTGQINASLLDGFDTTQSGGTNKVLVTNSSAYLVVDNWIRIGSGTGLYNANGAYFYEDTTYGWFSRSRGTSSSIRLQTTNGTARGWYYADSSANQGFLSTAGSWMLKVTNTGDVTATGNVTAYSDIRIKENVRTVDDALEKVKSMRGVYFDRKDTGKASVGVIAQEMEEILPQVVETEDTRTEGNSDGLEDLKTVSYGNIVGVLIEAIKDQQKQIDELKAKLEEK